MPLPEPAITTLEVLTRALQIYDGRFENQSKKRSKGFFRKYLPGYNEPHIKKLRTIKDTLEESKGDDNADTLARTAIRALIQSDQDYPEKNSAHIICEATLDYFLFKGAIFDETQVHKKSTWRKNLFTEIMRSNGFHFGHALFVRDALEKNPEEEKYNLNQAIIVSVANSSVESVLFALTHLGEVKSVNCCKFEMI